jgi:hypothetical protein
MIAESCLQKNGSKQIILQNGTLNSQIFLVQELLKE